MVGHLLPPRFEPGAEIGFSPRGENDGVVGVDGDVRESERERGGAADNLAFVVVLRPVARALEFVLRVVPRDDAAEMRAHGVETKISNGAVVLHDEVRRVTFEALGELAVTGQMRLEPSCALDFRTSSIFGCDAGTTTAGAEEEKKETKGRRGGGSDVRQRVTDGSVMTDVLCSSNHIKPIPPREQTLN